MQILIKPGKTPVDPEINRTLETLGTLDLNSEEYKTTVTVLERLYALKADDRRKPVSRDTIWTGVFNLLMAGGVIAWESKHVWVSKVPLNFIGRSKT